MALPGFKTTTTTQGTVLEAAIYLLFSRLEQIYPMKRLDEVATISSGGTPSRQSSSLYGGDIPWAKIGDITSAGKWISKTEETITESALEQSSAKLFPAGTVFFSMYGSIGKTSIAKRSIATNQAILGLVPSNGVPSEYLYYALINARVRLFSQSKGTSQKNINGGMVKDFKIPLPPAHEQEKIIKYLSLVEDGKRTDSIQNSPDYLIETRRIVERVEALATRIAKAQSLRDEASREEDILIYSAMRQIFDPQKIKHHEDLEKTCIAIIDNLHSNPDYSGDCVVPCIRSSDVGWGELFLHTARKTSEKEYRRRTVRGEPSENDIVLVREGGGTGKAALVGKNQRFSLGQRVMMLRPNPEIVLPKFFLYQLMSPHIFEEQILPIAKGSASPHLNIGGLRKFDFLLPPLDEQRRIVAYLDSVQARLASLRQLQSATGEELSALLPSVLDRAFKGEL